MPKAIFRFYEELSDFLPENRKKIDFEAEFTVRRSIKDMIEALGIPHTEIDLILINGKSVGFDYILQDGDHVSVYPVFERMNIESVTRLRKIPLRRTQFIADVNLGDIVKFMRILGFDVYFDPTASARTIIDISLKESRIILTKSRKLLTYKEATHGIFICPGTTENQIKKILYDLDIKDKIRPFSRCLLCNNLLESVAKDKIVGRIPPKTRQFCDEYTYCKYCDKIFWKGTHFIQMKKAIGQLLG